MEMLQIRFHHNQARLGDLLERFEDGRLLPWGKHKQFSVTDRWWEQTVGWDNHAVTAFINTLRSGCPFPGFLIGKCERVDSVPVSRSFLLDGFERLKALAWFINGGSMAWGPQYSDLNEEDKAKVLDYPATVTELVPMTDRDRLIILNNMGLTGKGI